MQTSSLKQQQLEQAQLLQLTKENEQVVMRRYNAGLVSYLEVVTAQNLRLQAEQSTLELQQIQLKITAQLMTALGGNISYEIKPYILGTRSKAYAIYLKVIIK